MSAPSQWEYRTFSYFAKIGGNSDKMKIAGVDVFAMPSLDKVLNGLAAEGWEIVSIPPEAGGFIGIVVRRPRR